MIFFLNDFLGIFNFFIKDFQEKIVRVSNYVLCGVPLQISDVHLHKF